MLRLEISDPRHCRRQRLRGFRDLCTCRVGQKCRAGHVWVGQKYRSGQTPRKQAFAPPYTFAPPTLAPPTLAPPYTFDPPYTCKGL